MFVFFVRVTVDVGFVFFAMFGCWEKNGKEKETGIRIVSFGFALLFYFCGKHIWLELVSGCLIFFFYVIDDYRSKCNWN